MATGKRKTGNLMQAALEHVFVPVRPWNVLTGPKGYTIFTEGKGRHVTDLDGKTYLDYWGGINGANLLGYGRKDIAEAGYQQMLKLQFAPTHDGSVPKVELARRLAEVAPGSLSRVFFGNGGTESIETAMKIARKYHQTCGFPKKYKIIGPYTYHGSTLGAMGSGYGGSYHWEDFEPLPPGFIHVAHPWCARCAFDLTYPQCKIQCARQIEQVILDEKPETVSAFMDTPISSSCFVPPPEYWPMVRSICDKYGVLIIADEIVTGNGRTGRMYACEHLGFVPDIMVLGKGLAGAYFPISAAIVTKEVARKFEGGVKEALLHSFTFEGLAGACAAAIATLDAIEKENLVENARILGKYLFERLHSLDKHSAVGEIRGGRGLMAEVELFRNKKAKQRFSDEENTKVRHILKEKLMEIGLFGLFANPLPICPSLTVTRDEVDEIIRGLDQAIGAVEKEFSIA